MTLDPKIHAKCHQAAESIAKIAAVLSTPQVEEFYIPLLKRLSQGEFFTSRTSSAALYPPVYNKVSWLIQEDLRKGFAALGADDTPMVRRAAAKWLGVRHIAIYFPLWQLKYVAVQPFVKNLSKEHILSDGLPIYRRLQSDDQDSVRLLTVEDLIVIAKQLTPPEVKEQLLKQIRHSIADKSWRVRYIAATHFNEVCP